MKLLSKKYYGYSNLNKNFSSKKLPLDRSSVKNIEQYDKREYPLEQYLSYFTYIRENDEFKDVFKKYIKYKNSNQRLTKEKFDEIYKNYPMMCDMAYDETQSEEMLCASPSSCANAAVTLKNHFDKKYGIDGYKIISIGTEPSIICEIMKLMGADTVMLPISGLKNPDISKYDWKSDEPFESSIKDNIYIALNYLIKNGVINTFDKKFILVDFAYSGATIKVMHNFLKYLIQIDEDKIIDCSLIDALRALQNEEESFVDEVDVDMIEEDMMHSDIADCCNVPHFNINDFYNENAYGDNYVSSKNKTEQEVFDEFDKYNRTDAWVYLLASMSFVQKILDKKMRHELP